MDLPANIGNWLLINAPLASVFLIMFLMMWRERKDTAAIKDNRINILTDNLTNAYIKNTEVIGKLEATVASNTAVTKANTQSTDKLAEYVNTLMRKK